MATDTTNTNEDNYECIPHIPLGLEIHRAPLSTSEEVPNNFCAPIMHQLVSTQLYNHTVLFDVDTRTVADTLGMDLERLDSVINYKHVIVSKPDEEESMDHSDESTIQVEEESREESIEKDGRFRELFITKKLLPDDDVRQFAQKLIVRLKGVVDGQHGVQTFRIANRRWTAWAQTEEETVNLEQFDKSDNQEESSTAPSVDSVESDEDHIEEGCGFAKNGHHDDIHVLCDGFAIVKTGKGLYRSARAAYHLSSPSHQYENGSYSYFEVYVVEDRGKDGMCIGVATKDFPLNKLVGSNSASVGLHSTGNLVSNGGNFESYGEAFKAGDRVGCLVRRRKSDLPPNSTFSSFPSSLSTSCANLDPSVVNADGGVELTYYVNGRRLPTVYKALDTENCDEELYPTISLYQKESKAVLCCCPDDWKHRPTMLKQREGKCFGSSRQFAETTASLCSA